MADEPATGDRPVSADRAPLHQPVSRGESERGVQPSRYGDVSAGDLRADAGHRPARCAGRGDCSMAESADGAGGGAADPRGWRHVFPRIAPQGRTLRQGHRECLDHHPGRELLHVGQRGGPDPSTIRIRYVDRIDLEGVDGDLDYHSFSGHFVVRVTRTNDDFAAVNLTVAGGNAWQSFSLTLDNPVTNRKRVATSIWETAVVAPCPVYEKREYSYRVNTFETFQVMRAHSSGYEKPHYSWYLENVLLNPAASPVALDVQCRDVNGHEISPPAVHRVQCAFKIDGGKLEFNTAGAFADITLTLRVVVSESSPGVMKNYYPARSLFTTVRAVNLAVEWDSEYRADFEACWKAFFDTNTKFQNKIGPRDPKRDPRPPWGDQIGVRELIRDLAERDHRSAYAVAAEVARKVGVPTEDVLEDVFRSVGTPGDLQSGFAGRKSEALTRS